MATPRIDFYKHAIHCLPPDKRGYDYWKAWIKGLSSQSYRLNNIFNNLVDGNNSAIYNPASTYNFGDEVVYKYKVYKSLISGNNVVPDTDDKKWQLILHSFIGSYEQSNYRSVKLTLEYALNRYFKFELAANALVGFKQPNNPVTPNPSDINITNTVPVYTSFVSYSDETFTSKSYTDKATDYSFTIEIYAAATSFNFDVNIPTSVYASINANPILAETVVRQFLDNYVASGIFYKIVTY